jgi:glycosyltransferase involved in cell wall biosynthesis
LDVKAVFLSHFFPPQAAPRAVQVARLAKYSSLPIRVLCAGTPGTQPVLRVGLEVMSFPDASSRWWRRAKHLLYLPDSERPWADRLARTVLAQNLITRGDVLVTFGQPMSDHLAGLTIKRRLGAPWIAHFSDPWSDNPYLSLNPVSRIRLRNMERQVLAAADHAMFTSHETMELVMRKYPAGWRDKASVLPHAYDPQFQAQATPPRKRDGVLVLRHLGNFYGQRNPLMLVQALVLLLRTQPRVLDNVRIELVGRWVLHERWSPADSGLPEALLSFRKSIEYEESLRQMRSADALLIIDAPFDKNVFFPSKLVDYLWARRPILALTPPGTSANIVAAAGGLVVSPESPETIAAGLVDMIQRLRSGSIGAPTEDVVARYDARRIAEAFDRVVNGLPHAGTRARGVDDMGS